MDKKQYEELKAMCDSANEDCEINGKRCKYRDPHCLVRDNMGTIPHYGDGIYDYESVTLPAPNNLKG